MYCREVNRGGLPMLYEILLEIAGPELKCALEVGFTVLATKIAMSVLCTQ